MTAIFLGVFVIHWTAVGREQTTARIYSLPFRFMGKGNFTSLPGRELDLNILNKHCLTGKC